MKLFGKEYDKNRKHFIYYIFGIRISKKDKLSIQKSESEYLRSIINKALGADKIPQATGEFRQWQLELAEMLKDFDNICRQNGVKYWLDFGTLLGAFRHKGFIPWDDDVDVSMMKSDLDKILPVLEEHYKNSDIEMRMRAPNCNNFQIRIKNKNYNLGMDIFQVYEYPETNYSEEVRDDLSSKILSAREKFEKKYKSKYLSKSRTEKAKKDIIEAHNELNLSDGDSGKEYTLCRGIEFPYEEDYFVMPYDEIFPLKEAEFEGYKLYVPNKSEQYMSKLWSNWHELPSGAGGVHLHYIEDYKNTANAYQEDI